MKSRIALITRCAGLLFCLGLVCCLASCGDNPADEFLDRFEALALKYEKLAAAANFDEARAELLLLELDQFYLNSKNSVPGNFPLSRSQIARYNVLRERLQKAVAASLGRKQ